MLSILELPEEMLHAVASYLPSTDLVAASNVNQQFNYIFSCAICKRGLNLQRSHILNCKEYRHLFYKNSISSQLSRLYMDGLWYFKLPAQIVNCHNIKLLHIMDIPLSFKQFDKILTSFLMLDDFAFTCPADASEKKMLNLKTQVTNLANMKKIRFATPCLFICSGLFQSTPNLQCLCISSTHNIKAESSIFREVDFSLCSVQEFKCLKEVTLHIIKKFILKEFIFMKNFLNISCRKLDKLDIFIDTDWQISKSLLGLEAHKETWLDEINFEVLRLGIPTPELYFNERMICPKLKELVLTGDFTFPVNMLVNGLSMPLLRSFHHFLRKSPKLDFDKIAADFPNLAKLSYNCFDHRQQLTTKTIVNGIAKLSSLTHLSVPPCILLESCKSNENDFFERVHFKKQRISKMPKYVPEVALFNDILNKCGLIQTLEIATFFGSNRSHSNSKASLLMECQSLCNINKLRNLTRLTLEEIPIYNSFFDSLAEGCTKLKFLRIKNLGKSINCEFKSSMAKAFPSMLNLQSLRIEQNFILPIGELLSALSKCPSLERIFLCSDINEEKKLVSEDLISFVVNNSKLMFAWFTFGNVTKTQLNLINKSVNKKKANHLYLKILSTEATVEYDISKVPNCHLTDMVHYYPWIYEKLYVY